MPPRKLTDEEKFINALRRIETYTVPKKDGSRLVTCFVPVKTGKLVKNKHANTYKVSVGKDKQLVHKFVYEQYIGPVPKRYDVSHLCHNESCCNLMHLHIETRADNVARIGCHGLLKFKGYKKLVNACNHQPRCIKVTVMDTFEIIHPNQVDQ